MRLAHLLQHIHHRKPWVPEQHIRKRVSPGNPSGVKFGVQRISF